MKHTVRINILIFSLLMGGAGMTGVKAQGVDNPLTIQQMDNFVVSSTRSRAMGGAVAAVGNDATVLFSNPASLTQLSLIDVRIGASYASPLYAQTQEWHPNQFYSELSLLFENRQDGIKNPGIRHYDTTFNSDRTIKRLPFDSVFYLARAYDAITPNWDKRTPRMHPGYAALAVPFSPGEVKIVAGAGYSEVVDLTHYYQNNNALRDSLGRYIGQWRPAPIIRKKTAVDTLDFNWFQYISQREGSVNGVTPSLAIGIGENISLGVSAAILSGSSDDREEVTGRGLVHLMYANALSIDSVDTHITKVGTSKYKGTMYTVGFLVHQPYYSFAISVHPSFTITRDWNRTVTTHKSALNAMFTESGTDKVTYPWNYSLGLGLHPTDRIVIGVDYEVRSNADATYQVGTTRQNPWLDSQIFRVGLEYKVADRIMLRGGYREDVQSYAEEGAAIVTDPIRGSVYTLGCSIAWSKFEISLAYEYAYTRYTDAWESNINYNSREAHTLAAELGYHF
jgi:hypothetical protein